MPSGSSSTATCAVTVDPANSPSRATASPVRVTSRKIRLSGPACGSIAACQVSAPARDCRHWKNGAPSEPRAMWPRLWRGISPGPLPITCSPS